METVFMIIVSVLSIMGFYFLIKVISSLIFANKSIVAAIMIDHKKQLRELDLLLDDASSALFAMRRRRLAVFVPSEIWNLCTEQEQYLTKEFTEKFGAEFFII